MSTADLIALISLFFVFLSVIVIPIFIFLFRMANRVTALESEKITKLDLEKIYNEMKKFNENVVSVQTCEARHSHFKTEFSTK